MTFQPRENIITMDEAYEIASAFIELGVKKIRVTGGEPLIRKNIIDLFHKLGRSPLLDELTLSSNGSHLENFAQTLFEYGVRRINVSLDTLDREQFRKITRFGDLYKVIRGIDHAISIGMRVKINAVVLKDRNLSQVKKLVDFSIQKKIDICFIEEMPVGDIYEHDRKEQLCTSEDLRSLIKKHYTLVPSNYNTGGPSRYWKVPETFTNIGFISPHSDNFFSTCNRVRVTAEGRLLLCLENEESVDLRSIIRDHPGNRNILKSTIINAIQLKPEKHQFYIPNEEQIVRFMNATGG